MATWEDIRSCFSIALEMLEEVCEQLTLNDSPDNANPYYQQNTLLEQDSHTSKSNRPISKTKSLPLLKVKKNGISLFGISFFVSEILT